MILLRRRKYTCKRCKDTGFYTVKEKIPFNELDPRTQAEIMVLGGYAMREATKECGHD